MFFSKKQPAQQLFYTINNAIVGTAVPQARFFEGAYDKEAPDSVYRLNYNQLPDFTPKLQNIRVQANTKVTDFISFFLDGHCLLVSEKVKLILAQFNCSKHIFYPVTLIQRAQLHPNYYLLLLESKALEQVNFKKTYFVKENRHDWQPPLDQEPFRVANGEELLEESRKALFANIELYPTTTVVNSGLLQLDLFDLTLLGGFHISERLHQAFIKQGITGLEMKPVAYEVHYDWFGEWFKR